MINVICQLIIMARSREGKKNSVIKASKYESSLQCFMKSVLLLGKLNLWYLEMPQCASALLTVMRELSQFEDWNAAAATKPCSEILSISLHLVGFFPLAIKSWCWCFISPSLNAIENLFLKIWSIFGSKTLSVRHVEPYVHLSFNLCFHSSSSSPECVTRVLAHFFAAISLCVLPLFLHFWFLCWWANYVGCFFLIFTFFPWAYSGRCLAVIAVEITVWLKK